jgi:hypothetical protein
MFFSSPSADLKVIVVLLVVALIVSGLTYFMTKKIIAAIFLMSTLSNFILFLNERSEFFYRYDIKNIIFVIEKIWLPMNILLLIIIIFNYFKNRNEKVKNK